MHPLRGAIYSGRALGVITQFWGHRRAAGAAVLRPRTLCQPDGVKAADAIPEGALLTAPWGALSKRRAPGFMEESSETHLQALLSFHLQEKRDLRWCLAHTLTSSSHVQQPSQPTFPPGEKHMKAIANSSAAGERLRALPSEVLALGSVEIAANHTKMSREANADRWPTIWVSCLLRGCREKIKSYLVMSHCHWERGIKEVMKRGCNKNESLGHSCICTRGRTSALWVRNRRSFPQM